MTAVPSRPDWVAVQAALHAWTLAGSGLTADKVVWAQQDAPRPQGPAIEMRISNIAETRTMEEATEDNPLVLATKTISAVNTGTNVFTCVAHGLSTGDGPVRIVSTVALPAPLLVDTDYWVIVLTVDTFQLAASYSDTGGGQGAGNTTTPIDLSSAGSGVITLSSTADTLRAGEEINALSRGYLKVTLELRCHSATGVGVNMATSILQKVRAKRLLPSQIDILRAAHIGLIGIDRVRAILGIRDAVLFETRAYADCHFCVVAEEGEAQTIIETATVENDLVTPPFTLTIQEP